MSSTNKTTYYELSQYVGSDKPTYLGDYNADMLKIDTGLHAAADAADTAVTTANAANSAATSASTTASTALSTAQTASSTATQAQTTAETASTNAAAAMSTASAAETAAAANTITNLAPAYDATLTYNVGDLVTFIDAQGSGKLYKCIVAVTTPESFNINKWDDVTVSELLASNIITYVDSDGVKSYGDIANELVANLDLTAYKYDSGLSFVQVENNNITLLRFSSISDVKITANDSSVSSTGAVYVTQMVLHKTKANCRWGYTTIATNGQVAYTDQLSIVPDTGSRFILFTK